MMSDSQQSFYDRYIDEKAQHAPSIHRGRLVIDLVDRGATSIVDIGCGTGELLDAIVTARPSLSAAVGMDIASSVGDRLAKRGLRGIVGNLNEPLPFDDGSFDVVVAAEVIEHVFDTDLLVREAWRVLKPGGSLVLTTPNLAYAANRVLLAFGIQPLWTETSTSKSLGRWLRAFGQHNPTQGHMKIFTAGALRELLEMWGFTIERFCGYQFFPSGPLALVDRILTRVPTLAAGFAVRARKRAR